MLPAQPNQSLIDGLAVLQGVISRREPVGSRALARELDLEPTRVNRLLKTLAHLGLAERLPNRRYHAGAAIHVLAAQALFGSGMIRQAIPHLEKLHRHKLIVAMGVLWRDHVSYLYHATPGMSAAEAIGRAGLFPAAKSGIGIALLAQQGDLRKLSQPTRAAVRAAREAGYSDLLTAGGQRTVGVAVPGKLNVAIAMSGQIDDSRITSLIAALRTAADAIALTDLNSGESP